MSEQTTGNGKARARDPGLTKPQIDNFQGMRSQPCHPHLRPNIMSILEDLYRKEGAPRGLPSSVLNDCHNDWLEGPGLTALETKLTDEVANQKAPFHRGVDTGNSHIRLQGQDSCDIKYEGVY